MLGIQAVTGESKAMARQMPKASLGVKSQLWPTLSAVPEGADYRGFCSPLTWNRGR